MTASKPVTRILGYAGLIPFVLGALFAFGASPYATLARAIAEAYAFGIICFLCGSWWGLAFRDDRSAGLWLSNLLFLIAFFVFVGLEPWWPLAAAVVLAAILLIEQGGRPFPAFDASYRSLRIQLCC